MKTTHGLVVPTVVLTAMMFHCTAASAALVAVEFDARITGSNMEGWRVGERLIGYFTYDSDLPPGRQTNSRPILAFGKPGSMSEFYWYDLTVYNNYQFDPWLHPVPIDGISLRFNFNWGQRYGYLSLTSTDSSLFTNNLLPKTIPPLERFDYAKWIGIASEEMQPYGAVTILIERLSVVPGSGLDRPVIFGAQRAEAGLSFRFLTEPATSYAVEFTGHLANSNWLTLTNIASTREPIVTVNDEFESGQRFYRIRKE